MTTETGSETAFALQQQVRNAWRRYLDALVPLRPSLHRYCCQLTGSVWDGEDLMQDTFLRVFGLLGKADPDLHNPRAYLIRTATNLWIDQQRRRALDADYRASLDLSDETEADEGIRGKELCESANEFLTTLPARERAAVLLRDVLDLSAEEAATLLGVSIGAVKSALHRGRERLGLRPIRARNLASPALVQKFLDALAADDLETLQQICSADVQIELVGGAQAENFDSAKTFFAHAHFVFPEHMQAAARAMGFGSAPHWRLHDYEGESLILGFRTLEGETVLNEVHRLEEADGKVVRVRAYCFTPETLTTVAGRIGVRAATKPHRSPDPRVLLESNLMSEQPSFKPPAWPTIVPRIVTSDARGLVEFIKQTFDATGAFREHAPTELTVGDSMLMISAAGERDAAPAFLYVYVQDTDATYQRAIGYRADSIEPPTEMPYGDRRAMIKDLWGNTWQIATHRRFEGFS